MGLSETLFFAGSAVELAALDLLLGADNAVLIALACRPLPLQLRKRVLLIGLAGAIVLRFGLMILTSSLLSVPGLRMAAAVLLVSISIAMLIDSKNRSVDSLSDAADILQPRATARLWESAAIVIAADIVMSLDNIVALVSVSRGSVALLILGLLMSVPALMYGSFVATKIFDESPVLVTVGAMFLGWIAGQMATSDVLTSAWISQQAPALAIVVPALCASYVYVAGRTGAPRSGLL
jgi:YjbE family integral membrane protein